MDLISIIIVLIVLGAAIYVAGLLPIDATFKLIIKVLVVVVVVVWLLEQLRASGALHF